MSRFALPSFDGSESLPPNAPVSSRRFFTPVGQPSETPPDDFYSALSKTRYTSLEEWGGDPTVPFAFQPDDLIYDSDVRSAIAYQINKTAVPENGRFSSIAHASVKHSANAFHAAKGTAMFLEGTDAKPYIEISERFGDESLVIGSLEQIYQTESTKIWERYVGLSLRDKKNNCGPKRCEYFMDDPVDPVQDMIILAGYLGVKVNDIFGNKKSARIEQGLYPNLTNSLASYFRDLKINYSEYKRTYEEIYDIFHHGRNIVPLIGGAPRSPYFDTDLYPCLLEYENLAIEKAELMLRKTLSNIRGKVEVLIKERPVVVFASLPRAYKKDLSRAGKQFRAFHQSVIDEFSSCATHFVSDGVLTTYTDVSVFALENNRSGLGTLYQYNEKPIRELPMENLESIWGAGTTNATRLDL